MSELQQLIENSRVNEAIATKLFDIETKVLSLDEFIKVLDLIDRNEDKEIIKGRSIGQKIGQGVARIIKTPQEMDRLKDGEILVTDFTDPDWEPIMKRSAAIVTNRGGRTCHAAIIAREMGIPAVVGCRDATTVIKDGDAITVSCAEGETGYVYKGKLPFDIDTTPINELPEIPVKLCINLANPETALAAINKYRALLFCID